MSEGRSLEEVFDTRRRWNPTWLKVFVGLLVLAQLAQGFLHTANGFAQSYWLVNYSQGFIRRGLTGAVLDRLVTTPTATSISVAAVCVAIISVAAVLVVIGLVLRLGTSEGAALAVLLACSPFVVDQMTYQRRPDQLGVVVIVFLGAAVVYAKRWRTPLCIAAGVMFGALCLVHEGIALYNLPVAVALTVVVAHREVGRKQLSGLVGVLVIPSILAVASVLLFGTRSVGAVQQLRDSAPVPVEGPSMFDFLGDSTADSLRHVLEARHDAQIGMLLLGLGLVLVHWFWLTREVHVEFFEQLWNNVDGAVRSLLLFAMAAGALVTFMLGVDWMRWFAELGTAWLIAGAFLLLQKGRAGGAQISGPGSPGVALPLWLPLLAVYLTVLPPLNESLGLKGIAAFFVPSVR